MVVVMKGGWGGGGTVLEPLEAQVRRILQGFLLVFPYCRRPKKVSVFNRFFSLAAKSPFIQWRAKTAFDRSSKRAWAKQQRTGPQKAGICLLLFLNPRVACSTRAFGILKEEATIRLLVENATSFVLWSEWSSFEVKQLLVVLVLQLRE